jgi:methyltransferase-like protein
MLYGKKKMHTTKHFIEVITDSASKNLKHVAKLKVLTEQMFRLNPALNGQQALKNRNLSFTL